MADSDADTALLQDIGQLPDDVVERVDVDPTPFRSTDGDAISRAVLVRHSDRVQLEWLEPAPVVEAQADDFVVSQPPSIAGGDLNVLYGCGDNEVLEGAQYDGLRPGGSHRVSAPPVAASQWQADPWPDELPGDSLNVPTYHNIDWRRSLGGLSTARLRVDI